jgi:murein DD-endopeptidase MepM/ murein hydrolase activator NlpD
MDFMRRSCAWVFVGAIIFVLDVSWGDVAISTAPLNAPAAAAVPVVVEPFVSPLGKLDAEIVSDFGRRNVLVQSTSTVVAAGQPKPEMHEGVDYGVPVGTKVYAARSGKVIFAGFSKMYVSRADKKDQHRFVIILHADGQSSRYVHLSDLRVRPGQEVKSGQVLGVVSESDEWTKPVLHFEIRNAQGKAVDPEKVIADVDKP